MGYTGANGVNSGGGVYGPGPKPKGGVGQGNIEGFLEVCVKKMKELSLAMVDPNKALNMEEYGICDVTGDEKFKTGTMYALTNYSAMKDLQFSTGWNFLNELFKIFYDEPTKMLMG